MRILFVVASVCIAAAGQEPLVQIINTSDPGRANFQVGDRFQIVITGAAYQPVSVRTSMQGRMDWGPVIGSTDLTGRWTVTGQFEKSDFGSWSEVWTVGGKLAQPALNFWVGAQCPKGDQNFTSQSGINTLLLCKPSGMSFATPSGTDPFRTPDGRLVPGRALQKTAEQYHAEIMQHLITSGETSVQSGLRGDEAGALIAQLIGVNALSADETRHVLSIVHAAFENPDRIPQSAKAPSQTVSLLQELAGKTDQAGLRQQIAEGIAYVQAAYVEAR